MRLVRAAAALPVVADGTRGDHVRPSVQAALVAGHNVVDREAAFAATAILAGKIVPPKNLSAGQFHVGSRASNL
jgi:hypothetical protein